MSTTEHPWQAAPPPAPTPPAVLAEACDAFARATGYQLSARAWLGGCWRFTAFSTGLECGRLFLYTGAHQVAKFTRGGPGATGGLALTAEERRGLAAAGELLGGVGVPDR